MKIVLRDITKRFIKSNVLDHINYQFELGKVYGINGANGTGKSTLLKIISGAMVPSAGKLEYYLTDQEIADSEIYFVCLYIASSKNTSLDFFRPVTLAPKLALNSLIVLPEYDV